MSLLKISKTPKEGRIRAAVQWDFLKGIFKHPSLFIKPIFVVASPKLFSCSLPQPLSSFLWLTYAPLILFVLDSRFSFYNHLPLLSYPLKFSLQVFSCFLHHSYLFNKDLGTKQINQESSINIKIIFPGHSWLWFCSWLSLVVVWTWFSRFTLSVFSHRGGI